MSKNEIDKPAKTRQKVNKFEKAFYYSFVNSQKLKIKTKIDNILYN